MCCSRWHPARLTELQKRYADKGGTNAVVVKLRLPDGSMYDQNGKIDYVEPTVSATTDTILLRAKDCQSQSASGRRRDSRWSGRWWMVPSSMSWWKASSRSWRWAFRARPVLSDQQGDYVYVVGADNKVEQRRIQLGQSTPTTAVVAGGLKEGEMVVADGIQRVRPGVEVSPGPASPPPAQADPSGGKS